MFSGKHKKEVKVLHDISFNVKSGEIIGIVGRNGSGKSTLLKIIAGIHTQDSGNIEASSNLLYLSGFGQGLQPRLSMYDNIFLKGTIMGLNRAEIESTLDDIIEFSGLHEFIDHKVYQFSSGMLTRLNFSIAIHCINHQNPDILLIDEILSAGGDFEFTERAQTKMEELVRSGTSVILVSHNMGDIKKYCKRVIFLKKGHVVNEGPAEEIVAQYLSDQ